MTNQLTTNKDFGSNAITMNKEQASENALTAIESSKAVQEVQASLIIAKRFPRDEQASYNKIMNACQRSGLAGDAIYQYSRGGTSISGASIRLAEAAALAWGNLDFGWREIERRQGASLIEAYCWDKETNTRREMKFTVTHMRNTKKGSYALTDERDIYENNANMASRRLRACILACIPSDVIEDAVEQCNETIKVQIKADAQTAKKMLEAFKEKGVNKKMIEARIQRNFDAIEPGQILSLRKIYTSLKDGMSEVQDWFDVSLSDEAQKETKKTEGKKKASSKKKGKSENLDEFKEKNSEPEEEEETQVTEDGEVIEPGQEEEPDEAEEAEAEPVDSEDDDDMFPGDKPFEEGNRV